MTGFLEVLKTLYMLMRNSVTLDSKSFPTITLYKRIISFLEPQTTFLEATQVS